MMNDLPRIVAHRGASRRAPENTLASLELGVELGADAVEFDVRLTADGHAVLMHDPTTGRTTGVERPVADQTLAELRTLDAGAWHSRAYVGQQVPTLDEALARVPAGRGVFLELKSEADDGQALVAAALEALERAPDAVAAGVLVVGFDTPVLEEVVRRGRGGGPACSLLGDYGFEGARVSSVDQLLERAQAVGASAIGVDHKSPISAKDVSTAHQRGMGLHVWTVNEVERARQLAALGVDSLTTDRPRWLREGLEQK